MPIADPRPDRGARPAPDDGAAEAEAAFRLWIRRNATRWIPLRNEADLFAVFEGGWDAGAEWAAARGGDVPAESPAALWGPPRPDPTHPGRLIRHGMSDGANVAPSSGEGDAG